MRTDTRDALGFFGTAAMIGVLVLSAALILTADPKLAKAEGQPDIASAAKAKALVDEIDRRIERHMILQSMMQVESGGRDVVGDGGRAHGPYQIHAGYFKDAQQWAAKHPEDYSGRIVCAMLYGDVSDQQRAEAVVSCYMRRYVPLAWAEADAETIARTHNGGPKGARKQATVKYWAKVQKELNR